MTPLKITVLISGSGTNLQALIDAQQSGAFGSAQIIRVISNRKSAYGLQRAEAAGIPTAYHNLVAYGKKHPLTAAEQSRGDAGKYSARARQVYDEDLADLVLGDLWDSENGALVVCAGWMHVFSSNFLQPMQAARIPVINLHPALPGAFNGTNAIPRALAAFQRGEIKHTGAMIHYVIEAVDMGRPLIQREVEILQSDTLETLEERIHGVEHQIIVEGARIAMEAIRAGPEAFDPYRKRERAKEQADGWARSRKDTDAPDAAQAASGAPVEVVRESDGKRESEAAPLQVVD